jgi:hypothetical protein
LKTYSIASRPAGVVAVVLCVVGVQCASLGRMEEEAKREKAKGLLPPRLNKDNDNINKAGDAAGAVVSHPPNCACGIHDMISLFEMSKRRKELKKKKEQQQ